LQKLREEFKNDLNARRNEELASFMERANKVVREVAPKQPCTVVFQEAVWVNASVDITARIASELP
jgi:outer membrane protein